VEIASGSGRLRTGGSGARDDVPLQWLRLRRELQMDLIRIRDGREIDHLELTRLFEQVLADQSGAIVQKWPVEEKDFTDLSQDISERVRMRPIVRIMQFADYDHDGNSTEFFPANKRCTLREDSGHCHWRNSKEPETACFWEYF